MAQTPDETRREIEETRLRIAEAADELEERWQRTTDWRQLINDYPIQTAAAAMAAGFIIGSGLLFRAAGSLFGGGRGEPKGGGGGGLMGLVRPIAVPVITRLAIDYFRNRGKQSR